MSKTDKHGQDEVMRPRIFGLHMEVASAGRYFRQGVMAIGFRGSGVREPLPDDGFTRGEENGIREKLTSRDGDDRPLASRRQSAERLLAQMVFASRIRQGDVVVFSNASLFGKDVVLGVVTGEHWEYVADDDTYCHHRRVRWTHRVPREMLAVGSRDIIRYIAPRQTIAKMNELFRERILSVQRGREGAIAPCEDE